MSLKLITHGVQVTSAKTELDESVSVSSAGDEQIIDLSALPPRGGYPMVTLKIRRNDGAEGSVEVPISSLPPDRRRGWKELPTGIAGLLAYQIIGPEGDTVLFLDVPPPQEWMARVPDNALLSELCVPGTHESSALHGYYISQCQTCDLEHQLNDGIRFLDVRLKVNEGDLQTFHGIRPQYSTLRQQLDWAEGFLRAHPSETLVMCLKEEGEHHPEFSARVYAALKQNGNDLWHIADHVPRLGEVRGKGIVFTRFGKDNGAPQEEWAEGLGLHPDRWPNDNKDGFEVPGGLGVGFRCHDWYGVQNPAEISEKASRVAAFLEPTLTPQSPQPLTVVFNTGATFPFATPQWVSRGLGATSVGLGLEGTNARLTDWLLRQAAQGRRPRATILLDYYQANSGLNGIAALLVALNFI